MGLLYKKKPGDDLLSHREGSTIGVEGLNFRVRNGNGCGPFTIITRQYTQRKRGFMKPQRPHGWNRGRFRRGSSFSGKTTFLSAATARDTRKSQKATFSSDEKVKDNMVKPHGRLVVVD